MSDLHINFNGFDIPPLPEDRDTILILAGDICEIRLAREQYRTFFANVCDQFKLVIYVFGNHEYYGDSYLRAHTHFQRECGHLDNLVVLNSTDFTLDGVTFIGTTLWTNLNNFDGGTIGLAKTGMADYNFIRHGPQSEPYKTRLHPTHTTTEFIKMRKFIFDKIYESKQQGHKTVVITHHHPSLKGSPLRFKDDPLKYCYCSEMDTDIMLSGPDYWICGHIHDAANYHLGTTNVICNPKGYGLDYELDGGFNPNLLIEI
jgi:DNA repair exonuclease SbcCD nuclease subunit